jgi:alpha-N-acetylglucosaminidase
VWAAWGELLGASGALAQVDTYRYDLVDVARQALADLSVPVYAEVAASYRSGDRVRFRAAKARFMDLGSDLDTLLATRREFLLGRWLADARGWGTTPGEQDLYERNARYLLTLWGPPSKGAFLHDYACREWSGLIRGFYLKRWQQFFDFLDAQPPGYSEDKLYRVMDRPGDESNAFYHALTAWEASWCDGHEPYPPEAEGDSVREAGILLRKWHPVMQALYPGFTWKKPPAPASP